MTISSGTCSLIIDGRSFEECTVALEMSSKAHQAFGFLSAPIELLKRAAKAKPAKLKLPGGRTLEIAVLKVNDIGVALITIGARDRITVKLQGSKRSRVIEGVDARAVCLKGERAFWNADELGWPIDITVRGGPAGAVQQVEDYLTALRDEVAVEQRSVPFELELPQQSKAGAGASLICACREAALLEELERRIGMAQLAIEKQCTIIAALRELGAAVDLAQNLLTTLNESLKLLTRHKEAVRLHLEKMAA